MEMLLRHFQEILALVLFDWDQAKPGTHAPGQNLSQELG